MAEPLRGSQLSQQQPYINWSAFEGKPPQSVRTRATDYERACIPRAIYNDPIEDLLLRSEGYSGKPRREVVALLAPLKPAHGGIENHIRRVPVPDYELPEGFDSVDKITSNQIMKNAETQGDVRNVVITECGIDIINPNPIPPIVPFNKPKYRSPLDRPVHLRDSYKAPRSRFLNTIRYGSWLNKLAVTDPRALGTSHRRCRDMLRGMDAAVAPFVLRYQRPFEPIAPIVIARGLSFRGRGHLDVRMGWSNVTELDPEHPGDLSESLVDASPTRTDLIFSPAAFSRHATERKQSQQSTSRQNTMNASGAVDDASAATPRSDTGDATSIHESRSDSRQSNTKQIEKTDLPKLPVSELPGLPSKSSEADHSMPDASAADSPAFPRDLVDNPWGSGSSRNRKNASQSNKTEQQTGSGAWRTGIAGVTHESPQRVETSDSDSVLAKSPTTHDNPNRDEVDGEWLREQKRNLFGDWMENAATESLKSPEPAPTILSIGHARATSVSGQMTTSRAPIRNHGSPTVEQLKPNIQDHPDEYKSQYGLISKLDETTSKYLSKDTTDERDTCYLSINRDSLVQGRQKSDHYQEFTIQGISSPDNRKDADSISATPKMADAFSTKAAVSLQKETDMPHASTSPQQKSVETLPKTVSLVSGVGFKSSEDELPIKIAETETVISKTPVLLSGSAGHPSESPANTVELVTVTVMSSSKLDVIAYGSTDSTTQPSKPISDPNDSQSKPIDTIASSSDAVVTSEQSPSKISETKTDALETKTNTKHNDNKSTETVYKSTESLPAEGKRSKLSDRLRIFKKQTESTTPTTTAPHATTMRISTINQNSVVSTSTESLGGVKEESNVKPSEKHHSKNFASSIIKGIKKSTENLSSKLGSRRDLSESSASLHQSADVPPPPKPSETAATTLYTDLNVKLGPKSSRFLNAMDVVKLRDDPPSDVTPLVDSVPVPDPVTAVVAVAIGAPSSDSSRELPKSASVALSQAVSIATSMPASVANSNAQLNAQQDETKTTHAAQEQPKPVSITATISAALSMPSISSAKSSIANLAQAPDEPLKSTVKVTWKEAKCDIKIDKFEMHCFETGKIKPYKHFFPMKLRRVVSLKVKDTEVVIHACINRKGNKSGGKLKKLAFVFDSAAAAKGWGVPLEEMVFGGTQAESMARGVLILVDKSDKEAGKLVEKYMKEAFEASKRPTDIKTVQYNEFSVANTLTSQDFKKLGNIVLTNPDFVPRLQQLLVRDQHCNHPVVLPCDQDPVDAALAVIRSSVGRSKLNTLHVTGVTLKREENKFTSLLNKFK